MRDDKDRARPSGGMGGGYQGIKGIKRWRGRQRVAVTRVIRVAEQRDRVAATPAHQHTSTSGTKDSLNQGRPMPLG